MVIVLIICALLCAGEWNLAQWLFAVGDPCWVYLAARTAASLLVTGLMHRPNPVYSAAVVLFGAEMFIFAGVAAVVNNWMFQLSLRKDTTSVAVETYEDALAIVPHDFLFEGSVRYCVTGNDREGRAVKCAKFTGDGTVDVELGYDEIVGRMKKLR